MKNSKLLNKKYLSIISFFLIFGFNVQSQEPADIWNLEPKITSEEKTEVQNSEKKNISQNSVYEMQSKKTNSTDIKQDETLISKKIEIVGLYDPAKNGLNIGMWDNSDGDQILNLITNNVFSNFESFIK